MASSMIHIAVANEINKKLNRDSSKLLIGSIAPDLSKQVGETKVKSHFLDNNDTNIPNLDRFLEKYSDKLNDDFVLGYFIHLYTDYLWFKYFTPEVYDKDIITKLDGTVVKCTGRMAEMYIYNDYTNMNAQLLDIYNLDLKIFYNDIPEIDNIIEEIPMDKLNVIIDQMSIIIENSKVTKDLVFNIENIVQFIETNVDLISAKLKELNIN